MSERRHAASLFSHSLKTPLSSVKVGAQLLLKHLRGKVPEKDEQLLEMLVRNATSLEIRINKLVELSSPNDQGLNLDLSLNQLEEIHAMKEGSAEVPAAEAAPAPAPPESRPETGDSSKIVVHADPEIADLIPKFLENRKKDLAALREALERGDFETIRSLGHGMKGAGGGFGFSGITEIGRDLEESAKVANAEEIRKGVDALAAYMSSVEVVYDEL
jgi:HPt (histidine-containing phosphotransfer) domain-containing protein